MEKKFNGNLASTTNTMLEVFIGRPALIEIGESGRCHVDVIGFGGFVTPKLKDEKNTDSELTVTTNDGETLVFQINADKVEKISYECVYCGNILAQLPMFMCPTCNAPKLTFSSTLKDPTIDKYGEKLVRSEDTETESTEEGACIICVGIVSFDDVEFVAASLKDAEIK